MPHVQQGLKRQKGRFYGMRQPRGTNRLKGKARLMFRKNMTMSIYLCICTCIFIALVFMYAIAWDSKHTKGKNNSVFCFVFVHGFILVFTFFWYLCLCLGRANRLRGNSRTNVTWPWVLRSWGNVSIIEHATPPLLEHKRNAEHE